MSENRNWIKFGRYSSPPMGKGKILDCGFIGDYRDIEHKLYLRIEVNGIIYQGALRTWIAQIVEDEEE